MAKILEPSIGSTEVSVAEVEHDWVKEMLKFKDNGSLPEDRSVVQWLRRTSSRYYILNGCLLLVLHRYVGILEKEGKRILLDLQPGVLGLKSNQRQLVAIFQRYLPHPDEAHLDPERLLIVFDGLPRQVHLKSILGPSKF
ncbi:hypothetical protein BHE74_00041666 [Ensete ventricosum]|nr:hypothetical protein BHE74_00041666 [Ensete ventricosum]RZS16866.1 hypothetical protein BHM03_00048933 [Ensete ventricosum]